MTKSQLLGAEMIGIDDLEGLELEAVKKEVEYGTGYEFKQLLDYDVVLIRGGYFEEYAQQEAGKIWGEKLGKWPFCCIDWDQAVEDLQLDYCSFDVDGPEGIETYWFAKF